MTGTNPYYYTQPQAPTAMNQAVPVAIPVVMSQTTTIPVVEHMQYPPTWQPDLPPPMGPVNFSPYNTMDQFMDPSLTADWVSITNLVSPGCNKLTYDPIAPMG